MANGELNRALDNIVEIAQLSDRLADEDRRRVAIAAAKLAIFLGQDDTASSKDEE